MSARKRARSGDTRAPPVGAVAPTARPGSIAIAAIARAAPAAPAAPDAITAARWATMIEEATIVVRKQAELMSASITAQDDTLARQRRMRDLESEHDAFYLAVARRVAADSVKRADPAQLEILEKFVQAMRNTNTRLESSIARVRAQCKHSDECIARAEKRYASLRTKADAPDTDLVGLRAADSPGTRPVRVPASSPSPIGVSVHECRVQ